MQTFVDVMRATQSLLRTIVGLIILRSQASLKKVHPEPKRRDLGLYCIVFVYIFCIFFTVCFIEFEQ